LVMMLEAQTGRRTPMSKSIGKKKSAAKGTRKKKRIPSVVRRKKSHNATDPNEVSGTQEVQGRSNWNVLQDHRSILRGRMRKRRTRGKGPGD